MCDRVAVDLDHRMTRLVHQVSVRGGSRGAGEANLRAQAGDATLFERRVKTPHGPVEAGPGELVHR